MIIKKLIAVSKTTILCENSHYKSFDGFVFGEAQAKEVFCANNQNLPNLPGKCYVPSEISECSDIYVKNRSFFIRFLLPQIANNANIRYVLLFDEDSFDGEKIILDQTMLQSLLIDDFYRILSLKHKISNVHIPVFENDKCIKLLPIDFLAYKTLRNNVWIFIPPNGRFFGFDFSVYKLVLELRKYGIRPVLFSLRNDYTEAEKNIFDDVLEFGTLAELIAGLFSYDHEKIFYRGWMTAYIFGAFLATYFTTTIVYLKDCVMPDAKEYKLLFGIGEEEFVALSLILENAVNVISHYGESQIKTWSETYRTDCRKFIFLPEISQESKWISPQREYTQISIVHAGSLPPTSIPQEFFPTKAMFNDIKNLTNKSSKLFFSCVVAEHVYDAIINDNTFAYKDWLYEDLINKQFEIIKGKDMDPSVIKKYHWGLFELSDHIKYKELIEYAIPSKFAFYLEAGLPVLVNKNITLLAEITQKFGIGIVFTNDEVMSLDNILDISQSQYDNYVHNILEYRKQYQNKIDTTIKELAQVGTGI